MTNMKSSCDAVLSGVINNDPRVPGVVAMVTDRDSDIYTGTSGERVERQPPCPRATTILAGFQAAEVGVSFNVSG